MQALATAIARTLRDRGIWAWSYIDNFLLVHPDQVFLLSQTQLFLNDLHACGFAVNPKEALITPTRDIRFLGFRLNTYDDTISHIPQRIQTLDDTLQLLRTPRSEGQGLVPASRRTLVFLCFALSFRVSCPAPPL